MESPQANLEQRRRQATQGLDRAHRATLGQFFTPEPIAGFMASLLEAGAPQEITMLDPGAGIGLLSAAAAKQLGSGTKITAYEIEPAFHDELTLTLNQLGGHHQIIPRDFIVDAVERIAQGRSDAYDVVILNPPYKKISSTGMHRTLMRKLGVEVSNLYACFLVCAIRLCRPGAQVVAIVPRSFMNGPYFKPFRYWLLDHVAVTHIHVFDRRDAAFSEDRVLQENVILRLLVGCPQAEIRISNSSDETFADLCSYSVPFDRIVLPEDGERFLHIPKSGAAPTASMTGYSLDDLGLAVCTGPVVDFRLRDHLRQMPEEGSVPLLYPTHFAGRIFQWPRESRKPNAIMFNQQTRGWLMPNDCYVVLRRFTAKEERRRIVASLLPPDALQGEWIGFENHLNVIHQNRRGLDPQLARGLTCYLNSQVVEDYFRTFSGHTQVNATDLRRLRYPSLAALREMGAGV